MFKGLLSKPISAALILSGAANAQLTVPNIPVETDLHEQSETSIALHPTNPSVQLLTWNDFRPYPNNHSIPGYAFTTDGGVSWTRNVLTLPVGAFKGFDPSCAIGVVNGNIVYYYCYATKDEENPATWRVYLSKTSTPSFGNTWDNKDVSAGITGRTVHDKPFMAIDNTAGPRHGWLYVTWSGAHTDQSPDVIYLNRSTDGGDHWLSPAEIISTYHLPLSPGPSVTTEPILTTSKTDVLLDAPCTPYSFVHWSMPAVAPNGDLYVCYGQYTDFEPAGCNRSYDGSNLVVGKSTDGGDTFTFSVIPALTFTLFHGGVGGAVINSIPSLAIDPSNGTVLVTIPVAYAGADYQPRIIVCRSTDHGATWAASQPVGAIGGYSGEWNFFPSLSIQPSGKVTLAYMVRLTSDLVDVYMTTSIDHGQNFGVPTRLTDQSSNAASMKWGFDYLGIASAQDQDYIAWSDARVQADSGDVYLAPTNVQNYLIMAATQNKTLSSSALSNNNQRKLFRESSGKLHEVFESGGEVFYRNSTDNGSSWLVTVRLSAGTGGSSAPCITMAGSNLIVAWQRVNGSNFDIQTSRSTNGGSTWSSPSTLTTVSCPSPGPLPTVSASGGSAIIAFRTSGSALSWSKSTDGGITWSTTGTVPGTTASCNSPSSTVYATQWSTPQANLAYATDISSGSPHVNYTFYDYNTSSWGGTFDLSAVIPSNYVGHANPCLATSPNSSGAWDLHTAWDAQLSYPVTRMVIHRKSTFRSPGSIYTVFQVFDCVKPSISCVSNTTAWMLYQRTSDGTIWKRYFNGTSWNTTTQVASGGFSPQLSVGPSSSAKYLYTTGTQSPYQVVLGTESLSKTSEDALYSRALNVIDPESGAFVTLEIGTPHIETKDGLSVPINFVWDLVDSVEFDLNMLLKSGMTEQFSIPSNATQLVVPVAIYGKDAKNILGETSGKIELNFVDSQLGTNLTLVASNKTSDIADVSKQVTTDVQIPLVSGILGRATLKLVPTFAGVRGDKRLIFSLGHIYRSVEGSSFVNKSALVLEQSTPIDRNLLECYPNPFNPATVIKYSLTAPSHVSIVVFDALGRIVARPVDRNVDPGVYDVRFDGSGISSGMYFARLQLSDEQGNVNYSRSIKLLLMK